MMPKFFNKEDDFSKMFDQAPNISEPRKPIENILSANEAFLKTKETHLKGIEAKILEAINKGETSVEILPSVQFVSDENKQILKDAGYTVIEKQTMEGNEIKISWE